MFQNYLWFFYALGAAIVWGIQYATIEQLAKLLPVPLLTLLMTSGYVLIYLFVFPLFRVNLHFDKFSFWDFKTLFYLGVVVLSGCASNLLINSAIATESATKASLIEISYPFFVALFAALIYKESVLSLQTFWGGIFILIGVIIVLSQNA
jgi:drug/metabolite transporter (DMT)-like permease